MPDSETIFSQINHFHENLISNIQGGVIICQFDPVLGSSKVVYLSEGWTALTGYSIEELNEDFGGNPQALVHPEDSARCNRTYIEQTAKDNSYQLEYRCRRKDGSFIWVIDRGVVTATREGYNQNQSIITNINPIKENEEKLRMSEARLRVAIHATHAAVYEFDLEQKRYLSLENAAVIFHTDAQAVLANFEAARSQAREFQMKSVFRCWYHPEDIQMLLESHRQMLVGAVGECEARVRQPNGSFIWCKLHHAAVRDEKGKPVRVIGLLLDIEEQHRKTQRLMLEAQSDALTGLYNKNAIRELTSQTLKSAPQLTHGMLMLDIDNFKGVNDRLGHLFGDAVLMDVSAKLKRLFHQGSFVGRIGGDEFIILLQGYCDPAEAAKRAKMICDAFRHTYSGEKSDYKISCSVGVVLSEESDSFDTLFRKADLALYQAKALGKDQFVLYSPQLDRHSPLTRNRVNQTDTADSGQLRIRERIFELLYDSVDFSGSVNMILALLGQLLETSHICIYENTADNQFAQTLYVWHTDRAKPGTLSEPPLPVNALDYYGYFDSKGIFCTKDFSQLPEELQKQYRDSGTGSTFQVAFSEGNAHRGFVRYDYASDSAEPSAELIEIMTFAAKAIGTFIVKKQADESAKLYNQNKVEALDNVPSAIYVIDKQYRLQYINNMTRSVYPDVLLGQKCHEVFMRNGEPCANCPAANCACGPCSTEIYNPYTKMWLIANASPIRWSGDDRMRLICCQIITQYKK